MESSSLAADTLFGADLTIMEEGTELLHRLEHHLKGEPNKEEPMPMFTSCCPGWVAMVEKSNPELIPFLSTCKSPQMMLGAVIKNYFAEEAGVTPDKICAVSVMPCVRKQGEADRPWFNTTGLARDVDHVITTVELGKVFVERGIKLQELEPEEFDNPLGEGSGGALLFGTTGGVMEAAIRTVYELVTGTPMERLNFSEVRWACALMGCCSAAQTSVRCFTCLLKISSVTIFRGCGHPFLVGKVDANVEMEITV